MPYAWQSVEEAALTLGISARTLHRRVSKGEVETRLTNGRREVLVCLPDPEPDFAESELSDTGAQSMTTTIYPQADPDPQPQPSPQPAPAQQAPVSLDSQTAVILAEKDVELANERVRRTELALAAFQHTSQLLQREASRSRISARLAWAAVAILSVGVYVAVGWTASRVTRAKADNEHLTDQLQSVAGAAEQKATELQLLREQLAKFQQSAARAEGELQATRLALDAAQQAASQAAHKPATRPSWLERIVKLNME